MTIAAKWVGDVPAHPDVIDVDLPIEEITVFTSVAATLTDPLGGTIPLTGAAFTLDVAAGTVTVNWGSVSRFTLPGLYRFQIRLTGAGSISQRMDPELFVVEDTSDWFTLGDAHLQWTDAPFEDVQLHTLLESSKVAVLTYAPALTEGTRIPANYRQAQLMQARSIWNAAKGTDQAMLGPEGFALPVYPLDKNIRQLLRPKSGLPVIF